MKPAFYTRLSLVVRFAGLCLLLVTPIQLSASEIPPHNAGDKLAETDLYQLFTKAGSWCLRFKEGSFAYVSLVFKVDANYVVEVDDAYKRRFEQEILPIIQERCRPLKSVSIYHYIYGFRISSEHYRDYPYDAAMPGTEEPFSYTVVEFEGQAGLRYIFSGSTRKSLADLRKGRAEDEERVAKAQQEQAARARMLKEAENAERRHRQEIESKGGIEPSGDDLAIAFTKWPQFLACPHFENMEWCNIAPPAPIWLRLKGGHKHSCEAIVVGADYHCRFKVEYECLVQGLGDNPAPGVIDYTYCLEYRNPPVITTGVRRTLGGWRLYDLEEKMKPGTE
jgi:hypothetical protein